MENGRTGESERGNGKRQKGKGWGGGERCVFQSGWGLATVCCSMKVSISVIAEAGAGAGPGPGSQPTKANARMRARREKIFMGQVP